MKAKIIALNARFTHSCLALFYIRNELNKHCSALATEIYQFTINDPYYELVLRISEGEPDYLFFSTLIWNSELVQKLICDLRITLPDARFIVGGPQAEVVSATIGDERTTVVLGEIEAIDATFYQDLEKCSLQTKYTGSFLKKKVAELPFPYLPQDFEKHLKNRHVYYESSRGCPFSCSYCRSSTEKGLFHKPLEQVYDELNTILSHGVGVVRFIDRTFNDKPDRALEIWRFLSDRQCSSLFHFEVAPDRFTDEILDFLATVPPGKFQFEIGIQSTNTPTLQAINRRVDTGKAHASIFKLRRANNIHLHVDLILGLPYESPETFAKSFRDVFAMNPHYIQMGLLKLLPDTQICQGAEEDGYYASSTPPYSVFANKWLDHRQLTELYWFSECVEKFLNNRYFVSLWDYVKHHGIDVHQMFEEILTICKSRGFFQLAATHEFMGHILLEVFKNSNDYELIRELLVYDWLRCGHRFMPTFLLDDNQEKDGKRLLDLKKRLFAEMDDQIDGLYTIKTKSQFFKKALFYSFSKECLEVLGFRLTKEYQGYVCFKHEREKLVHNLCETVLI